MAESKIPFAAIRNIDILGDTDEQNKAIVNQLKADNALADLEIRQIKQKGPTQFVLKCATEEIAIQVEAQLKEKYREGIAIKAAAIKLPQIKLIRINGATTDTDEIHEQLLRQNKILREGNFEITSSYEVKSPRGSYINAILQCDLQLHNKIVQQRTLIYGFSEVRVFEHVEILQCARCLGYGHLAGSCKSATHCRRCSEAHAAT